MSVLAVAPVDDLRLWARVNGLQVVLVVLGSILLSRAVRSVGRLITQRIDESSTVGDALVRSEQDKHRHSVAQVLIWLANVLIFSVAAVRVLNLFDLPITGLVAPATVLGVALGFGAQRVVQDLLAGVFIITERQYAFGDVVRVMPVSSNVGVTGTVEEISLRITRLRSSDGEVIIIPNGQILHVTNLSRDWARAVVDVPLPPSTDITAANRLLRQVGKEAFADPALRGLLLDEPTVMGVESLTVESVSIRVIARTLPGKQFEVGRRLRSRIVIAFNQHNIAVSAASVTTSDAGSVAEQDATEAEASPTGGPA